MSRFVGSLLGYLATPYQVLRVGITLPIIGATIFFFHYKAAIKRQKDKINERLARGLVYRDTVSKPERVIKALELHPTFARVHASSCQMCSLGEYLSTLRFFTDNDKDDKNDKDSPRTKILEKELYLVMASLLMQAFGESVGAAFLPVLGMKPAESLFQTISSKIVSYIVAKILVETSTDTDWDPTKDMAAMPFNVSEIMSFVNLNQKLNIGNMEDSPLKWMERGEIAYNPSYDTPAAPEDDAEDVLLPNPFVVEDHFEAAILGLEERIRSSQREKGGECTYDPGDRSVPEPTPINRVILPDLYLGFGDAKNTHTQRERLRNRLFAVLLTKLSYNYEKRIQDQDDYFIVRMSGTDCTFPDEFIQALCDSGHSIEVCPRSTTTTFGMGACVKEADGSWTQIPIAFFFRTGYESGRQRPAYWHALHGGIDLKIEGPLVGVDKITGVSNKCGIQFYMAIEGMCGWHSNDNIDVPWTQAVSTTRVYDQEEALAAVRMSGILACAFNQIGTEMNLPFGGYGVLGVCNDTAAIIDFAVRGETNMYPLLSTGRFLMHIAKSLTRFHDGLLRKGGDDDETMKIEADTLRLAFTACNMQSDIHCSPNQMIGAAKRYASNYPNAYFQISEDSQEVMKEISKQYVDLESKISKNLTVGTGGK